MKPSQTHVLRTIVALFAAFVAVPLVAHAQTVHRLSITDATPLQIKGLLWGMDKQASSKYLREYQDNDNNNRFGLPYYNLEGVEFEVWVDFDETDKKYDDKYKVIGETSRRVSSGLNGVWLHRRGACNEEGYFRLKKALLNSLEVARPERVSGATDLKDREIDFLLPSKQGDLTLLSRCDHRSDEWRWISLRFNP